MHLAGWSTARPAARRRPAPLRWALPLCTFVALALPACGSGGGAPRQEGAYGRAAAYSSLPAYRGSAWADALQQEQNQYLSTLRESPVGGFESGDATGRFLNVRDGVRASAAALCDCPEVRLWLTGGSAAFGLGQRDDHTIASELTRLAATDGVALRVSNLGVPGRTLWNEYRDVERRLEQDGERPPDLLVSYGGFNDAVGALGSAAVGKLDPGDPNLLDNEDFARWGERGFAPPSPASPAEIATVTADRYRRAQDRFDTLAARHGVDVTYVFQPDALASPAQFRPVADVWTQVPARIAGQVGAQLESVSTALDGSVLDLRHLLDADPPAFADWAHSNEEGARRVAAEIYRTIRPELLQRAGR